MAIVTFFKSLFMDEFVKNPYLNKTLIYFIFRKTEIEVINKYVRNSENISINILYLLFIYTFKQASNYFVIIDIYDTITLI